MKANESLFACFLDRFEGFSSVSPQVSALVLNVSINMVGLRPSSYTTPSNQILWTPDCSNDIKIYAHFIRIFHCIVHVCNEMACSTRKSMKNSSQLRFLSLTILELDDSESFTGMHRVRDTLLIQLNLKTKPAAKCTCFCKLEEMSLTANLASRKVIP
jgi:hypothetical protein